MKAYKGFNEDLTCMGYQFREQGSNQTVEANCRSNGFHCAENPLDCLNYYRNWLHSVYYEVEASGDLDEDGDDSKIACTEIKLIRRLSLYELLFEAIVYMAKYPKRTWSSQVYKEKMSASNGYVVVRGKNPQASGTKDSIIVILKESKNSAEIIEVALFIVDNVQYMENTWYDSCGHKMEDGNEESRIVSAKAA